MRLLIALAALRVTALASATDLITSGAEASVDLCASTADGACVETDQLSVLQVPQHQQQQQKRPNQDRSLQQSSVTSVRQQPLGRVSISKAGKFTREGAEVLLLGGNYVVKAQPHFPEVEVVRRNAKLMAEGAARMKYRPRPAQDGSPRQVVPVVRLGAMMEGAMPASGGAIDAGWAAKFEATLEAFADAGVYVFLDAHQDAFSTTNGGNGIPWWITAHMQETALHGESYIVSSQHPLELSLPEWIQSLIEAFGLSAPKVLTMDGDKNPWHNYAVGENAGNPAHMNVGNLNMRLNNDDTAWGNGTLLFTKQVQNIAVRLFNSHKHPKDKAAIFDHFVTFYVYLCRLWEKYPNIVAVELFNEPPVGGIPDFISALKTRKRLYGFYHAVLEALDAQEPPIRAPVAVQDVGGAVEGSSALVRLLEVPRKADNWKLRQWARRQQLIFSFHYYPGFAADVEMDEMIELAHKQASYWGNVPIFLSEFFTEDEQTSADALARAAEQGTDAVTYWHFVDRNYTGSMGWYRYPESVTQHGEPIEVGGHLNLEAWKAYAQTVENGTFWGADITGAEGGKMDVLSLVPEQSRECPRGMFEGVMEHHRYYKSWKRRTWVRRQILHKHR